MTWTLIILGMAVATYLTKALILLLGERVALSTNVKQALGFVPICVLTAIIVPITLAPHGGNAEFSWRNAHLVGAVTAVITGLLTRHMLLTIGVALGVFFLWQFAVLR